MKSALVIRFCEQILGSGFQSNRRALGCQEPILFDWYQVPFAGRRIGKGWDVHLESLDAQRCSARPGRIGQPIETLGPVRGEVRMQHRSETRQADHAGEDPELELKRRESD